jgi:hypothetical protein
VAREIAEIASAIFRCLVPPPHLAWVPFRPRPHPPESRKEKRMKDLSLDEVLAIAGGLPPIAALDEETYRNPAEPLRDPIEQRRPGPSPESTAPQ